MAFQCQQFTLGAGDTAKLLELTGPIRSLIVRNDGADGYIGPSAQALDTNGLLLPDAAVMTWGHSDLPGGLVELWGYSAGGTVFTVMWSQ